MTNRFKITLLSISVLLLAMGVYILSSLNNISSKEMVLESSPIPSSTSQSFILGEANKSSTTTYKVERVIDGDTFEVDNNGRAIKVRYVGIDTPETVDPRRPVGCFGKEASAEDKSLLEGKSVRLKKDVSETDKFGRWLRLVYLPLDNGTELFVNDYLIREGFAKIDTIPPDITFASRFLSAQQEAQKNQRGLWSPSTCNGRK